MRILLALSFFNGPFFFPMLFFRLSKTMSLCHIPYSISLPPNDSTLSQFLFLLDLFASIDVSIDFSFYYSPYTNLSLICIMCVMHVFTHLNALSFVRNFDRVALAVAAVLCAPQ